MFHDYGRQRTIPVIGYFCSSMSSLPLRPDQASNACQKKCGTQKQSEVPHGEPLVSAAISGRAEGVPPVQTSGQNRGSTCPKSGGRCSVRSNLAGQHSPIIPESVPESASGRRNLEPVAHMTMKHANRPENWDGARYRVRIRRFYR